jgi:hypothetical protein
MAAMVEALLGAVFRDSGGRVEVARVAVKGWDWLMISWGFVCCWRKAERV